MDNPHLSYLLFAVRLRRKDRWKEGSNYQELRCQLHRNLSLMETIVVKCSLRSHDPIIETALCDTRATGYAFIDENFAHQHNLPKYELGTPRPLDVIDGRPIASRDVTYMVKVFATIGNHEEELPAFLTTLGDYKVVLEIPWMRDHDVKLDFAENSLEFTADKCRTTCMKTPAKVYSELPKHPDDLIRIAMISATSYHRMTKKKN